jgi:outer membrane receptor protein involved in Fe transport
MALGKRNTGAILILLALILLRFPLVAGTTGKIVGTVVDKSTKEPLLGVNVVLEGMTLGGATDVSGGYIILNVPPGTYRLKASLVGYGPTVVTDVRVFIDQTSTVAFELESQAVITGEVVVVATREIVRRDVSTSVTAFSYEEVRSLPVTSVAEVTGLQAGVEGGLVIRGGSADQALFLLDGATMRDPRNNQPITGVPLSAVSEISIERGGFNAEYGQLRSGITNVVTKEGNRNNYNATLTVRMSPPTRKYNGISPYDPSSMWLRPYLDPAVAWTGTSSGAWDLHTQQQYPSFEGWDAVSRRLIASGINLSPAAAQKVFEYQHRKTEVLHKPDYNIDGGIGGPVPLVGEQLGNLRFYFSYRNQRDMLLIPLSRDDYYEDKWSLKLTSDLAPSMKLDVSATIGKTFTVAVPGDETAQSTLTINSTSYMRTPDQITANISGLDQNEARVFLDSYFSTTEIQDYSGSALFTHVLGPKAFYEIRLEQIVRHYITGPVGLRDPATFELIPGSGYYVDQVFGYSPHLTSAIDGMWLGGHTGTTRDSSKVSATTLKGNLTAQVDKVNEVKAGFEFVYNDLDLNYGVITPDYSGLNTWVIERTFPIRGGAYVQDKLEFEGFIANLGLRLDFNNANIKWPVVGQWDKNFYSSSYDPGNSYPTTSAKAQWSLSPRLGISHPITENSKLFFNYGHFKQLPTYEQMLILFRNYANALRNFGDPNLLMASTVAYELGFDYSFLDEYLVQMAGFYRDITDQQDFTTYFSNAAGSYQYVRPNNNSYQDIRGFELTLRKTAGSWIRGFANYTYQVSKSGRFNEYQVYQDPVQQRTYDQNTQNLYQFRPTPAPFARLNLSVFTPAEFGPKFAGQSIFGDWALDIIGEWRAGGYTSSSNFVTSGSAATQNNVELVDYFNVNLRLSKSLDVGRVRIILFADVANLIDTKRLNLNSFYDSHDRESYFNSLHLPASPDYRNIVGDDKIGDYRPTDVAFQPIEQSGSLPTAAAADPHVIYYVSGVYYALYNGALQNLQQVDPGRLSSALDKKAYIDMPNMSSFWFLNPRQIFFGITASLVL